MNQSHPTNIGKTVEVKTSNRPLRVAYIVPFDETPINHMVLDAVFHESYTRWAGAYTVIIPANTKSFLDPAYQGWLEFFDPDFVYTYLELHPDFIEVIDRACCPIAFLKHDTNGRDPEDRGWHTFTPEWGLYFTPVSSLTTISSPQTQPTHFMEQRPEVEVTVATEYPGKTETRLFKDNFGTAFDSRSITYPVPGLYRTLCLVPPDLPANHVAGTERCTSMVDMLSAISTRKVRTVARFSMAHSESISKPRSHMWSNCFNLFIGSSLLDRLHFWNARHFTPSHAGHLGSLILEPQFFSDPALVNLLGQYLNHNNFLGRDHGSANVSIRSRSRTEAELRLIGDTLRKSTYNTVIVDKHFCLPAVPKKEDLKPTSIGGATDTSTFKLSEHSSTLTAKEPSHFVYIPPRFKTLSTGQWIIELEIQRHNNLSQYSNIIDEWELPRRRNIVQAFTNNLGKVTNSHKLAILPSTKGFPFADRSPNQDRTFSLSLPSDGTYFQWLVLDIFKYANDDQRTAIKKPTFKDLQLSDKGQNLRGVISMFDSLSSAYQIMSNKYWRRVLRERKNDSPKHLVFTKNQLVGYIPNDHSTKDKLRHTLGLGSNKEVTRYLEGNLTDTLEYLIRLNIFYCIHQWRCEYCGHTDSRNFDNMKIKNACDICSTEYLAPIDLEWKYQLNDFVYRSLVLHTGLPVLWTLGHLQERSFRGSFWYLPEVNLYEKADVSETKKEIDILCMHGGKFIAVEVKRSVKQLLNSEEAINSFIYKINLIRPDIAILAFEQYCDSEGDLASAKSEYIQAFQDMRSKIDPTVEIETIVASETHGFNDAPDNFGYFGQRTDNIE